MAIRSSGVQWRLDIFANESIDLTENVNNVNQRESALPELHERETSRREGHGHKMTHYEGTCTHHSETANQESLRKIEQPTQSHRREKLGFTKGHIRPVVQENACDLQLECLLLVAFALPIAEDVQRTLRRL